MGLYSGEFASHQLYSNGLSHHGESMLSFLVQNGNAVGDKISHHSGWEIILGGTEHQRGIEIEVAGNRYDMSKTLTFEVEVHWHHRPRMH